MAQNQVRNLHGIADTRNAVKGGKDVHPFNNTQNVVDIAKMRSRLKAISASTYTDAQLDKMTMNDMLYAIRLNDEKAGM